MQKMMSKKAVSNVIATVSILLLTLVLISIVGVAVNKIVSLPELSPQMSCLQMQTSSPLEIQKACYNSTIMEIKVSVKRKLATAGIEAFDFVVHSPTESSVWCCGPECANCDVQSEGQTKTYVLPWHLDMNENNKAGISINDCLILMKNINAC